MHDMQNLIEDKVNEAFLDLWLKFWKKYLLTFLG